MRTHASESQVEARFGAITNVCMQLSRDVYRKAQDQHLTRSESSSQVEQSTQACEGDRKEWDVATNAQHGSPMAGGALFMITGFGTGNDIKTAPSNHLTWASKRESRLCGSTTRRA